MAELTTLESKLGEVAGLAMAAKSARETVMRLAREEDEALVDLLRQMNEEAAETEERCTELAGALEGKKGNVDARQRASRRCRRGCTW